MTGQAELRPPGQGMLKAVGPETVAISVGQNTYLYAISMVAALGGLLFGYDWVVIGGAKPFYEKFFELRNVSEQGWAMSCALVGCLWGAVISGSLSDRYGRKLLLILAALLFGVSSVGTALAQMFHHFVMWRIVGGMAIGLASNLSPMYIAEISPAAVRGKLVSLNQLTIVIGILLAQFVNWLIAQPVPRDASAMEILNSWNGQMAWRWMFGVTAIPSLLFFLGMLAVPESPRWLASNGRHEEAKRILARLNGEAFAKQALAEIDSSLATNEKVSFFTLLDPKLAGVLFLGV